MTDVLNLQLENAFQNDVTWQVFDLNGRTLGNGVLLAEQTTYTLPVNYLPEGFYVVRLQAGQETVAIRFKK